MTQFPGTFDAAYHAPTRTPLVLAKLWGSRIVSDIKTDSTARRLLASIIVINALAIFCLGASSWALGLGIGAVILSSTSLRAELQYPMESKENLYGNFLVFQTLGTIGAGVAVHLSPLAGLALSGALLGGVLYSNAGDVGGLSSKTQRSITAPLAESYHQERIPDQDGSTHQEDCRLISLSVTEQRALYDLTTRLFEVAKEVKRKHPNKRVAYATELPQLHRSLENPEQPLSYPDHYLFFIVMFIENLMGIVYQPLGLPAGTVDAVYSLIHGMSENSSSFAEGIATLHRDLEEISRRAQLRTPEGP